MSFTIFSWFHEPGYSKSTDDMAKALTEASIFMAFVSNSYAIEDECVNIFKYARLTLKKVILAVAIGDGFEWKQSKLGIFLADEVSFICFVLILYVRIYI